MWAWMGAVALAMPGLDQEIAGATAVTASLEEQVVKVDPFPPCTVTHATVAKPVRAARASSELTEGALTHAAARAIDGDRATAWVEGVAGEGRGESLTLALDREGDLPAGLRILPGYAKDRTRWGKNRRVARMLVRWLEPAEGVDPAKAFAEDALRPTSTEPLVVTLATEGGAVPYGRWQVVDFMADGTWHHNMEITEVVAVQLVLLDAESTGATYEDTVISEVGWVVPGPRTAHVCDPGWCASERERGNAPEGCATP